MNLAGAFLELHDLDQLLGEADDPTRAVWWRKHGYVLEPSQALHRERDRLAVKLDRRWLALYERSLARYGRGLSAVRNRVCLGCRLTLPTAAAPPPGEAHLHLCEGCGRLLLWD